MGDGGDIIIKGGSVRVTFDVDSFKKVDKKEHLHDRLKMTRIVVKDGGGIVLYDSGKADEGMDFEVRVSTRPA